MIYLDYAATSWPKPPEVLRAICSFLEEDGGNPGRSGHRLSIAAGRTVNATREALARLLNAPDPLRIVLASNATHALNIALQGLLQPGDRVVTTGIEHNAMMRPLRHLERHGVVVDVVPCARDGRLDLAQMREALARPARLVALNHASNVLGTITPVEQIAPAAHAAGALLLVDAAQTAGALPIDVQAMEIDLLAFTGHKSLLGPPGTGGLVIGDGVDVSAIAPLMQGGTGSLSEREEQPQFLPDRLEVGTPNGPGIAGLGAGVGYLLERGVESIRAHEVALTRRLLEGLGGISQVRVYGPMDAHAQTPTVSVSVEGLAVSEVGLRLDDEFGVLTRAGLHCAPAAHRTSGTCPEGTVRLSAGVFTSLEDIDAAVAALRSIAHG